LASARRIYQAQQNIISNSCSELSGVGIPGAKEMLPSGSGTTGVHGLQKHGQQKPATSGAVAGGKFIRPVDRSAG